MRSAIYSLAVGLLVSGCASGTATPDDSGDDSVDAAAPTGVDAGTTPVPGPADASTTPEPPTIDGAVPGAIDAASPPPDATPSAPDAATGPCDPVTQTGCSAGEKCAFILDDPLFGDGHTGCTPNGSVTAGGACDTPAFAGDSDDCVAGTSCSFDRCLEICAATPDTCSAGSCVPFADVDFSMCLPGCDLLDQDCGAGQGCYLTDTGPVCADTLGAAGPGGSCSYLNDCAAGSGCFDDGLGGGVCLAYCNYAVYPGTRDPDTCEVGELCGGIVDEDVYGVCG